MEKNKKLIVGICIVLLCISVFLFWNKQRNLAANEDYFLESEVSLEDNSKQLDTEADTSALLSEKENREDEKQAVYVAGAVKNPGLYYFSGMARVGDAIKARGGFKKNAAKLTINLARKLEDGEQITVITKKEAKKAQGSQQMPGDSLRVSESKINLNTASKEQLMTIPGIGEAKANAIMQYRNEQGSFLKAEDIMNISGIKEGVYNKIKDYITT